MSRAVRVATFRPDDGRLAETVALLDALGAAPVGDPLLSVAPTGALPEPAEYVVLTSPTAADLLADGDWDPGDATVCAIGPATADALRAADYRVDRVPAEYSSAGMVAELREEVNGATVEVARSDHGSARLLDGLRAAGATVHETVLYRLERPVESGAAAEMAAAGDLEGVLFTSSLTVEHFLEAAAERGVREAALDGLGEAVVGAIGDPTRRTAEEHGIAVDVVPDSADAEALATAVVERAAPSYHE
jgi:uroporphyrinogen-III synthase